jgi:hypothetical protein
MAGVDGKVHTIWGERGPERGWEVRSGAHGINIRQSLR